VAGESHGRGVSAWYAWVALKMNRPSPKAGWALQLGQGDPAPEADSVPDSVPDKVLMYSTTAAI
jgi:hypothetical protein